MQLNRNEEKLVQSFKEVLQKQLRERLKQFVLFGSRARNEADEDSDLDVLVVVAELKPSEKSSLLDTAFDLAFQCDIYYFSPLIVSEEWFQTLKARERRLALDIEKEGVPL